MILKTSKKKYNKKKKKTQKKSDVFTMNELNNKIQDITKDISAQDFQNGIKEVEIDAFKDLIDLDDFKPKKNKKSSKKSTKKKALKTNKNKSNALNITRMKFFDLEAFLDSDEEKKKKKKPDYIRSYKSKKNGRGSKTANKKPKIVRFADEEESLEEEEEVGDILYMLNDDDKKNNKKKNFNKFAVEGGGDQKTNRKYGSKKRNYNTNQKQNNQPEKKKLRGKIKLPEHLKTMEDREKHFAERRKAKKKALNKELKKKFCFKPKINKKSERIDKERNELPDNLPRYEVLHELNYVLKDRENELRNIMEEELYEDYMEKEGKECTFKPKINPKSQKINSNGLDVSERNKLWDERKKAKIERIKEKERDKDLRGCTFKPKINY